MTFTLEHPTEAALTAADRWTVPGEWNHPNHGFGSGDTGEARILAGLEAAFAARRLADAQIARLAVDAGRMMTTHCSPDANRPLRSHRSVAELLVDVGRIPLSDAHRLHRVGVATEPRTTLHGEVLPAQFGVVRTALDAGTLPVESANHIITALNQAAPRAEADNLLAAEETLVAFARDCPADLVRNVAASWRDALDTDGIEPREETLAALSCLHRTLRPNGMKRYILDADPLSAAYLDAAIDAHIGATIRRPSFTNPETDTTTTDSSTTTADPDAALFAPRSIAQLAAETIIDLARHGIACNNTEIPIRATTIVVRMTLENLLTGLGTATIDGIEHPISAATARRLAAEADIIPMVLGGDSDILDLGTTQRLFSRAQKIAMAERFGGCAWRNCPQPPNHTEAHHLHWWGHTGPTNLRNGILLCSKHHHEIHRNNWTIHIHNNTPWFIPPTTIDPHRTPRRGGKPPPPPQ